MSNLNENIKKYNNSTRKNQYFQQPKNSQMELNYNSNTNISMQKNYQKMQDLNIHRTQIKRHTVATPYPADNLFDLVSTKSALEFIPPDPQNNIQPKVSIIKINLNRKVSNKSPNNYYSNKNNANFKENLNKNVGRILITDSNINRTIHSKSPINSENSINSQSNFINKILENNNIFNNTNSKDKNNNNQLSNKHVSFKINNNIKNNINNYISNLKNNDINVNNNSSNNNSLIINNIKKINLQNQFMNRNIDIISMLKRIEFFERLKTIGKKRMELFEQEFQKDIFFMRNDFFDNTFIKEDELDKFSPLTLIFHFIFNPETVISQFPYKKSFFESIFELRGDKNIKINYSPNDLKQVPKYFNDFNYVNDLFNNFNENNLNNFLNEIEKWKKTFSFELQFVHPLKNNIGQNQIEINDVIKVYFISPNDLIIDYHSYAENFPLSDSFVSISQYNFHCDIQYDKNNGRFIFKTNAIVYNKLQIINQNIIQNVIKKEADNINSVELLHNTWKPLLNIIREESKKNKIITDKIFKEHLRKTLNKYSKNKPQINFYKEEQNLKGIKDIDTYNNSNIMNKNQITYNNYNNFKKSDDTYEKRENINSESISKLSKKDNIILSENNNNNKENIKEVNNIFNESKFEKNNNQNKNCNIYNGPSYNNNIKEETEQNSFLFYGVLATLFLFIFKTVLSIEYGNISSETFFNILIIIIIGFMLIKNHIIDNNNYN